MENRSKDITSGSIYDGPEYSGSNKWNQGRVGEVGNSVTFDDGRKFVFCSTAVDLTAGQLVATPTALATIISNLCAAASIGSYRVVMDLHGTALFGGAAGTVAENCLAGGYITMSDDLGEGYTYRIKSNTAGTSAAASRVTITLFDPLKIAIDATTDVFLVSPRYTNVVVATATLPPVGVAVIASTAATNARTEYIWVQVAGVAGVKIETGTNVAIGKTLAADANGGVKIAAAVTDVMVGVAMATSTTTTQKLPVLLQIGG